MSLHLRATRRGSKRERERVASEHHQQNKQADRLARLCRFLGYTSRDSNAVARAARNRSCPHLRTLFVFGWSRPIGSLKLHLTAITIWQRAVKKDRHVRPVARLMTIQTALPGPSEAIADERRTNSSSFGQGVTYRQPAPQTLIIVLPWNVFRLFGDHRCSTDRAMFKRRSLVAANMIALKYGAIHCRHAVTRRISAPDHHLLASLASLVGRR